MNVDDLIKEIELKFSGVKKPRTSLRQYALTDQKGLGGVISDDEWKNAGRNRQDNEWQDIPDSEIEECDCVLAHMPAEDFIYYLPAYMRYSLISLDLREKKSGILGFTVSALYASTQDKNLYEYVVQQHALLNGEQIDVVKNYLAFVSENADEVERPGARKALERYWNRSGITYRL